MAAVHMAAGRLTLNFPPPKKTDPKLFSSLQTNMSANTSRHIMKSLLRSLLALLTLVIGLASMFQSLHAQVPDPMKPARLVNDFAGLLSPSVRDTLEVRLVRYADTTSTQIAVVTVLDLGDLTPVEFATELGTKWGVGTKENNGVVLLVKPKTEQSKGQVFIAPGYGLEAKVTDAICSQIIQNIVIPRFKDNDYEGGIAAGAQAIMEAASGEFQAEEEDDTIPIVICCVIFVGMLILFGAFVAWVSEYEKKHKNDKDDDDNDLDIGSRTLLHSGTMAGLHSSSSSSFGGGFGGFGGFGGGSFGGAGAGGSW